MKKIDRRTLLKMGGAAGLGIAGSAVAGNLRPEMDGIESTDSIIVPKPVKPIAGLSCELTPEALDGPYYFHGSMMRRNICEDKAGLPIRLGIQLVDTTWAQKDSDLCFPIENATVDVWHADALGVYSNATKAAQGIDTVGQTYCRGAQQTDASGYCEFETLLPGWYLEEGGPPWHSTFGRTVHIHCKVYFRNKVLTTQIYFPDDFLAKVYDSIAPYNDTQQRASRKTGEKHDRPQNNEDDWIFAQGGPVVELEKDGEGYFAKAVIGTLNA